MNVKEHDALNFKILELTQSNENLRKELKVIESEKQFIIFFF